MGFGCVKECRNFINGKEEIDFCLVGYKQFIYYSDEKEKLLPMSVVYPNESNDNKAEQLIFKITTNNEKKEYL